MLVFFDFFIIWYKECIGAVTLKKSFVNCCCTLEGNLFIAAVILVKNFIDFESLENINAGRVLKSKGSSVIHESD
jgi:hypothetical protein